MQKKIKKILITFSGFLALGNLTLVSTGNAAPAEFPDYPHSRLLCHEHLIGNPMHIDWKSVDTKEELPKVVTFFEEKIGVKAMAEENGSFRIVHPANPHLDLTVYPKTSASFFPSC